MYLVEAKIQRKPSGFYLPDPEQPDHGLQLNSPETIVKIDGHERELMTDVLAMMMKFNSDASGRAQLKHDCHVFALACQTGDDQRGVSFDLENGGSIIKTVGEEFAGDAEEPSTTPGGIVSVRDQTPDDALEFGMAGRHVMVRASIDYYEPLYVSKPGVNAAVAVHNFEAAANFYNAQSAGIIRELVRVDPR